VTAASGRLPTIRRTSRSSADRREEFVRRVHLDLTGAIPRVAEVRAFLADPTPTQQKRAATIDRLIASEEFNEFWTNKWADLLQVNRKFLGPAGSLAYRNWIRESIAQNKPYDQFVREILTATGSNRTNPPASYFKVLRSADEIMENTTHLFLGIRFNCNKCHDHPFERWTQDQYYETAAYFARTSLRRDPESGKETIGGSAVEGAMPLYEEVFDADAGEIKHERTGQHVAPAFPFEVPHATPEAVSRREQMAAWLTDANNPYFARSYVNRLWAYLMGVGLIDPIDDIRAGNPPTNPELLDHLATAFIRNAYSIKAMHRMVMLSSTYQQSSDRSEQSLAIDPPNHYLSAFPKRRLEAEAIRDTLLLLGGSLDLNPSGPHPFPPQEEWGFTQHRPFKAVYETNHRSVYLMTQRIVRHPFLAIFDGADPAASTAARLTSTTPLQSLYFLNDPEVHHQADRFAARVTQHASDDTQRLDFAFRHALGRAPLEHEIKSSLQFLQSIAQRLLAPDPGLLPQGNPTDVYSDLVVCCYYTPAVLPTVLL
jgi:hypothetical protein